MTSILLVTSNGTGMGHLARQLAVGLAAGDRARAYLLSMSAALPATTGLGIEGEYCPGPDRDWVPAQHWPQYVAGRVQALGEEIAADVVAFDGVAPYRGIALARSRMRDTPFVWFRRGMWKSGVNAGQLWKSELFDLIIEPGDLASKADKGPTASRDDAIRVPPVSLVEVVPPLSRTEAARELGLDPDRRTVLMTLGAGRLGDLAGPGQIILDALVERSDWQVAVVTSAIARETIPTSADERIVRLQGVFPLVRYLQAFDAAVSAAGYNSVHELIPAGLPTLLVPNTATRTDDQSSRAAELARQGLAIAAPASAANELVVGTARLLTEETLAGLRESIRNRSGMTGGARRTADELIKLGNGFVPNQPTVKQRLLAFRDDGKEAVKRLLGPGGTNTVRRLLGRPSLGGTDMLEVTLDPATAASSGIRLLQLVYSATSAQLLGDDPIEVMIQSGSDRYRQERELLAHRSYMVTRQS